MENIPLLIKKNTEDLPLLIKTQAVYARKNNSILFTKKCPICQTSSLLELFLNGCTEFLNRGGPGMLSQRLVMVRTGGRISPYIFREVVHLHVHLCRA